LTIARHGLRRKDNWTLEIPSEQSATRKEAGAQAYAIEHVVELYRRIDDQKYRDCLFLMARYGLHYTELERLAEGNGDIEEITDSPPIAGVIRVWHKNKKPHPIFVDAQALGAAKRIQALGSIPSVHEIRRKLRRACGWTISQKGKITGKNPKVKEVLPLVTVALFRHTFITLRRHSKKIPYQGQQGLTVEDMVEVSGHAVATARKHYDLTRLPGFMVDSPLKLSHPDDPLLEQPQKEIAG